MANVNLPDVQDGEVPSYADSLSDIIKAGEASAEESNSHALDAATTQVSLLQKIINAIKALLP